MILTLCRYLCRHNVRASGAELADNQIVKRMLVAGVLAVGLVALSACGGDSTGQEATSTDTSSAAVVERVVFIAADDLPGIDPVSAPPAAGAPERIVSLATGVGETLAALGVAERVVGRDETSDVAGITDAPVVTQAHSVSAEKVLGLSPDLVIVDAATAPAEALDQIAGAGVQIVEVPEAWTLADMAPRITAVAAAVQVDPDELIAQLPTDSKASDSAAGPRVAFLYLRGTSGIYLLGGEGSGADALIEAAGGVDVGAESGFDPFVPLTAEALVTLDPDVLLIMTKGLKSVNGVDGLLELPGVAQTKAGRDGRVIVVDDEVLLSFGPRTPALVDRLSEALSTVMS